MMNDFVSKLSSISTAYMDDIFEIIPASIYCKDKAGKYLTCNNRQVIALNLQTTSDVLGNTDFDFIWKRVAPRLRDNDQAVIHSNKPATFIEQTYFPSGENRVYLSYKAPLRSKENKVI